MVTPDTAGKGVGEGRGDIENEEAAVGGEGTAEPVCMEFAWKREIDAGLKQIARVRQLDA